MDYLVNLRNWWSRLRGLPIRSSIAAIAPTSAAMATSVDSATAALQSAAVWACVRLISQSIAALPAHVFEETETGKVKAIRHPLYQVLTREPNALMTYFEWLQATIMHLLLWGNAFSLPQRVDGEVFALWPLDPARVRIVTNPDGSYFYRWMNGANTQVDFQPLDLLHFRIFSIDGIIGLSPLDFHRLTFDAEAAAQGYAASLYLNGGRPSGVLEYPNALTQAQVEAIRTAWNTVHSGPANAGQVAVLYNGMKYTAVSMPLQSMEYMSSQQFSVEQIARIFGVPPHMVGAANQPTYASVEQQSLEFSSYTQVPIVRSIEQTIETRLLKAPFFYRLNLSAFARADLTTRYRAYSVARQWGWMSVNDIRELEDLNRIGDKGDVYLEPLNMIPATAAEEPREGVTTP